MMEYERFDSVVANEDLCRDMPEVSNITGVVLDVRINVRETESEPGLKIYKTETKADVEFIEDPSKTDPPKTGLAYVQWLTQCVVEHIAFRLATVFLIILDFVLVIIILAEQREKVNDVDACIKNQFNNLEIVSHIIISYFVLEILLRAFYMERRFFYNWMEIVDMIVVMSSFVVDIAFIIASDNNPCKNSNYQKLLVIGRVFRVIRIVRIIYFMVQQRRHVATATRRIISQNKRRYQKDGFDLDLCYITERVIAMSFPSAGLMSVYRNPIREVARFFDKMHKDHYRIYNLCSERDYDEKLFHNRVERIFIDDHNVPLVKDMIKFCKNAQEFMAEDKRNVIAVHCKGGKGRTGAIICLWLVHCGIFEDAKDSLAYFGDRRTDLTVGTTFQGVETPSQSRFVGYYEKIKKLYLGELPPQKELKITSFKIESIAGVGNGDGSDLSIELRVNNLPIFECKVRDEINCKCQHDQQNDSIVITLSNAPVLVDDVKVRFLSTNKNFPKIYDHCAFYFWFHTSFIENNKLRLARQEIDNPHKKAGCKVFRPTFAIEVDFQEVSES